MPDPLISAKRVAELTRLLIKHATALEERPLTLLGAMRLLEPGATLEEFGAAAEAVLGRNLLDPADPAEDTGTAEELQAEIGAALGGPDIICLKEAAALAGVNQTTMARWAERYRLGRKVGGRWQISRPDLTTFKRTR